MMTEVIKAIRDLIAFLVGTPVVRVSAKFLAAAGNYAANDVLSGNATDGQGDAWEFRDCARTNGGSFWITSLHGDCSEDSILARIRVHFFTSNPIGAELDDNAAFALVEANRAYYLDYVDLPAFADRGGFSSAFNDDVRKMITCAPDSRSVWAIVEILDAETAESAGMQLRLAAQIERL